MIEDELKKIPKEKVRDITRDHISEICSSNQRDFRF
jgi:2-iminoacetate synthase